MSALLAVLPALLPVFSDGLRGLIGRMTGGTAAKPQNVAEVIQLMQADTARLEAIAKLDSPAGTVSQWVANIRALQRPIAVMLIIAGYLAALACAGKVPAGALDQLSIYAQMVTFYLFGDRTYNYLKGK